MTSYDDFNDADDLNPPELGEDPTPEELKVFWAWVEATAEAWYGDATIPL